MTGKGTTAERGRRDSQEVLSTPQKEDHGQKCPYCTKRGRRSQEAAETGERKVGGFPSAAEEGKRRETDGQCWPLQSAGVHTPDPRPHTLTKSNLQRNMKAHGPARWAPPSPEGPEDSKHISTLSQGVQKAGEGVSGSPVFRGHLLFRQHVTLIQGLTLCISVGSPVSHTHLVGLLRG